MACSYHSTRTVFAQQYFEQFGCKTSFVIDRLTMPQLRFDVCIFAGLVCRECGVALDSMEMRAFKLKRHLEEQHDNMELDHQREFKRLSALMEKCASSLLGYVTDGEKAQFCQMFLTCDGADVVWCAHQSCGRAYLL